MVSKEVSKTDKEIAGLSFDTGDIKIDADAINLNTDNVESLLTDIKNKIGGGGGGGNDPAVESTTPLVASDEVIGASRDCHDYSSFGVYASSDVDGTLYVEESINGTDWAIGDTIAVVGGTPQSRVYSVTLRYNRVRYDNGGVDQTAFVLATMRKTI